MDPILSFIHDVFWNRSMAAVGALTVMGMVLAFTPLNNPVSRFLDRILPPPE